MVDTLWSIHLNEIEGIVTVYNSRLYYRYLRIMMLKVDLQLHKVDDSSTSIKLPYFYYLCNLKIEKIIIYE